MKQILVIGAGRSAVTLIDYLLKESHLNLWKVTIADYNLNLAENLASNNSNARPIFFNVNDEQQRENEIRRRCRNIGPVRQSDPVGSGQVSCQGRSFRSPGGKHPEAVEDSCIDVDPSSQTSQRGRLADAETGKNQSLVQYQL